MLGQRLEMADWRLDLNQTNPPQVMAPGIVVNTPFLS